MLTLGEVTQLAKGRTAAHRQLQELLKRRLGDHSELIGGQPERLDSRDLLHFLFRQLVTRHFLVTADEKDGCGPPPRDSRSCH